MQETTITQEDIEFLSDIAYELYYLEDRSIDNSNSTCNSYYVQRREDNDNRNQKLLSIIDKLKGNTNV